jgi:hypothetical protein
MVSVSIKDLYFVFCVVSGSLRLPDRSIPFSNGGVVLPVICCFPSQYSRGFQVAICGYLCVFNLYH